MSSHWPIELRDAAGVQRLAGKAKGVPPISGALGVVQVPISFDEPGLATGVPLAKRSPIAPEFIIAAWFDIDLPWDVGATTPKGDIYTPQIIGDWGEGLIAHTAGEATSMRAQVWNDTSWRYNEGAFFWPTPGSHSPLTLLRDPNGNPPDQQWYVVVSSDGTPTGGDPGATDGHALLNILLARPT